ncbi:acyl-CoA dehydrogenase family protein [Dactylosporangium sp. NPDC050588]|uniref:acyl-CoA dehydrogenase family protein n=1 Tax=Dactylosporangium sp. NPDC050588 TaxID=3157211 RepID=UPI0033DCF974
MTDRPTELVTPVVADPDVVALLNDIFGRYRKERPPRQADADLDRDLWRQLDDLGLTRLSASEASGGSGASWAEAAALLSVAAGAAAPVPLAEHDVLGAWLLDTAGLPHDGALRTVCRPDPAGAAADVPWARSADAVVALWRDDRDRWLVADVPAARLAVDERRNLAGEPSDTVRFDHADLAAGVEVPPAVAEQFHLRGALARTAQVAGAMERVLEVVLAHANERVQFGRPIGRFQAMQHLVTDIAAETALARAATDAAVARAVASDWQDPGMLFAVGVAKSCAGHASSVVVRGAHQVVGAIGTTLEHELHTLTLPILVRRGEYGSVHHWDETITHLAASAGHDGLWTLITTGRSGQETEEVRA